MNLLLQENYSPAHMTHLPKDTLFSIFIALYNSPPEPGFLDLNELDPKCKLTPDQQKALRINLCWDAQRLLNIRSIKAFLLTCKQLAVFLDDTDFNTLLLKRFLGINDFDEIFFEIHKERGERHKPTRINKIYNNLNSEAFFLVAICFNTSGCKKWLKELFKENAQAFASLVQQISLLPMKFICDLGLPLTMRDPLSQRTPLMLLLCEITDYDELRKKLPVLQYMLQQDVSINARSREADRQWHALTYALHPAREAAAKLILERFPYQRVLIENDNELLDQAQDAKLSTEFVEFLKNKIRSARLIGQLNLLTNCHHALQTSAIVQTR